MQIEGRLWFSRDLPELATVLDMAGLEADYSATLVATTHPDIRLQIRRVEPDQCVVQGEMAATEDPTALLHNLSLALTADGITHLLTLRQADGTTTLSLHSPD